MYRLWDTAGWMQGRCFKRNGLFGLFMLGKCFKLRMWLEDVAGLRGFGCRLG